DGDDVCPTKAGSKAAKGCPDQDEDGIVDEEDECMDEKGPRASFGCPDEDKDMVPDYRDQCPTEPASKGADPMRSDGCPKKVYITKDAIKILDKVFFDTGKATIKPASHALLDEIANTLVDQKQIKKVQIEGHTDNVGDPAKNKVLSEDRAKSVMAYLTGKGIAAERLTAVGFGQEKPLVDGEAANTKEGREQNRRVEFNITEQEAVTVTFTREALTTEDHQVELKGDLKVVKAVVPQMRTVMGEPVCDAILTIGEDGMVKQVVVNGCVAMPRSVTRRTLEKWQFEPMKDSEGKPQSVTVELKMAFKAGRGTPEIDEKSIKPVE
ncbi:MAG: OmpA family protein, partial [Myxococcales bacterium]|nr:OmpA family protein [Myxococcales bacterium]